MGLTPFLAAGAPAPNPARDVRAVIKGQGRKKKRGQKEKGSVPPIDTTLSPAVGPTAGSTSLHPDTQCVAFAPCVEASQNRGRCQCVGLTPFERVKYRWVAKPQLCTMMSETWIGPTALLCNDAYVTEV